MTDFKKDYGQIGKGLEQQTFIRGLGSMAEEEGLEELVLFLSEEHLGRFG